MSKNIDERQEFVQIDDDAKEALKGLQPLIARVLPDILHEFYGYLKAYPALSAMFGGQPGMDRASAMQFEHWNRDGAGSFRSG